MFDSDTKKVTLLALSVLTTDPDLRDPPENIAGAYHKLRENIATGAIVRGHGGQLIVKIDIPGLSPSAAHVFVEGTRGNGWLAWLLSNGDNIDSLRRVKEPQPKPPMRAVEHNMNGSTYLEQLVEKINDDEFTPPGAKHPSHEKGWRVRLGQYAYAKSLVPNWVHAYRFLSPIRERLSSIVASYPWEQITRRADIKNADLEDLEYFAETICIWGGVPQKKGYSETWCVVKSAVLERRCDRAPMNSGWTKVASLASESLAHQQTIWDSRVSTSIIHRLDALLNDAKCDTIPSEFEALVLVNSRVGAGTRPRKTELRWKRGSCSWDAHFAGGKIVRKVVKILRDHNKKYGDMPTPTGGHLSWDIFGVGMVLFMDGY